MYVKYLFSRTGYWIPPNDIGIKVFCRWTSIEISAYICQSPLSKEICIYSGCTKYKRTSYSYHMMTMCSYFQVAVLIAQRRESWLSLVVQRKGDAYTLPIWGLYLLLRKASTKTMKEIALWWYTEEGSLKTIPCWTISSRTSVSASVIQIQPSRWFLVALLRLSFSTFIIEHLA